MPTAENYNRKKYNRLQKLLFIISETLQPKAIDFFTFFSIAIRGENQRAKISRYFGQQISESRSLNSTLFTIEKFIKPIHGTK